MMVNAVKKIGTINGYTLSIIEQTTLTANKHANGVWINANKDGVAIIIHKEKKQTALDLNGDALSEEEVASLLDVSSDDSC